MWEPETEGERVGSHGEAGLDDPKKIAALRQHLG